jgi:transcriptional regulator with XRE-family HTH domain
MMKNRLKAVRTAQSLTQTELAERASISQRLVSSLETEDREGSMETWQKLAKVLDCDISYLIGGTALRDPSEIGPESILTEAQTPPGLRQLALDAALIEALQIKAAEWRALASMEPPGVLTKEGYVALLCILRLNLKSA